MCAGGIPKIFYDEIKGLICKDLISDLSSMCEGIRALGLIGILGNRLSLLYVRHILYILLLPMQT